jgi:hypothetical protein
MGPARVVLEAGGPAAQVAVDPFVARLTRDAIPIAELRDGLGLAQVVGDELRALVHGCGLPPRHGHLLGVTRQCFGCYPRPWAKLLPMGPDRTRDNLTPRCSGPGLALLALAAERGRWAV